MRARNMHPHCVVGSYEGRDSIQFIVTAGSHRRYVGWKRDAAISVYATYLAISRGAEHNPYFNPTVRLTADGVTQMERISPAERLAA